MVYLASVENVITLGKLIGLLFLFCLPLLSTLFLKTKRNDLARPVMGTIFLVIGRAKRAPHWGCSIEISCDICNSWRASEASETLSGLRIADIYIIGKWFPFVRERAHS